MSVQGFTNNLVALGSQVEVVVHVLVGDATIGMDKARIHVEERGMGEGRHSLLDQLICIGISVAQRVWQFTSRKQPLQTNERMLLLRR